MPNDNNELVKKAQSGDNIAFDELKEVYFPLIKSISERYYRYAIAEVGECLGFRSDVENEDESDLRVAPGGRSFVSKEEFRQEASIAFYGAVTDYNVDQDGVTFGLYAKICIKNRMISLMRKIKTRKKKESKAKQKEADKLEALLRGSSDPEKKLIQREKLVALSEAAEGMLSRYEKTVFDYYLQGAAYKDIAEKVGRSEKSVDNAIYRIKVKLKNVYK